MPARMMLLLIFVGWKPATFRLGLIHTRGLKIKRAGSDAFIRNDGEFQVKDECFHDTAIDLAVYALLTLICWEQEQLAEDTSGAAEELPRATGCAPTQASARSNH